MKKNIFKVLGLTVMMSLALPLLSYADTTPTFSEYWYQDGAGAWHINDGNGNIVTNAWLCDDAVVSNGQNIWYLIDANGNMVSAGLVQDQTGSIYSLETSHNGYYGMLRYQSGNYDGIYLDLEANHNGAFAKIKNQDGVSSLQGIYGLTQVNIDNSNIVYTSSFSEGNTQGQPHHSDENYDYYLVNGAYVAVRRENPDKSDAAPSQAIQDEINRRREENYGDTPWTSFAD